MPADQPFAPRDRALYNALWLAEHCFGKTLTNAVFGGTRQALRKRIRDALDERGPGQLRPLDRRSDLDATAFHNLYVSANVPVVLAGAASNWPAASWTPQWIGENYGDDEVLLIAAGPEDIGKASTEPQFTTLAEIVRGMEHGSVKYARFNPLLQRHPELRTQLDVAWLRDHAASFRFSESFQMFLGGKGTTTAVHAAISNNLFVNLYGRKRWRLFSPEFSPVLEPPVERAPYFISVVDVGADERKDDALRIDGFEVILEPGDVLFVPSFWWHWVTNLSGSIGIGYRFFSPYSIGRSSVTQALLTGLSTNPPAWEAKKHRQDFTRIFAQTRRGPA